MHIRALVVDDEPRARSRLKRLLAEHPDVEVIGEAADGEQAVAAVLSQRPTVVFLDVQMPGRTGLEAARILHQTVPEGMRPMVVFTTAYDEHAVDAFALESTDYLLKPVERGRLGEALRRVRKALWSGGTPPQPPTSVPPPPPEPEPTVTPSGKLAGHRGGRLVPIDVAELAAVIVEDTISFGHVPGGKLRLQYTLQELEQRLPSERFFRVSRSAIVQLDWIAHLKPHESAWMATLRDPVALEIPVSRRRARRLKELLEL